MTFAARLNQIEAKLLQCEQKEGMRPCSQVDSAALMVAICNAVKRHYDLPDDWHTTRCRKAEKAWPRLVAMFLIREFTDESTHVIGDYFGGKNHVTVLCAANRVKSLIQTEPKVREEIESWRRVLQQLKKETELH